ncbi:Regulator of chromosome condensation (RCC1) repeat containing protein [Acidovorax sp. CF316]|uniref:RCC1 domain-containing protein n=1 Tax=Acidovorax sp. CF316 TaxID=1144317 RepID=UPI00026BCB4C|nr:hypothetical protein [Acidovorax sp. CF316]EJE52230.1 Regulator of chromosome condensation (RCC1) repeat containing protein [Acidovorax sp. CF316]
MNHRFPAPRLVRHLLAATALVLPAAFLPSAVFATTVSMGTSHGCSVADTSLPTCWGSLPIQDQAPDTVLDVRAGRDFSCALMAGRTVRCWGNNDFSQLGVNAPSSAGPSVGGLWRFTQLAVGGTHACALLETQAYCWGDGSRGQLGAGSAANSAAPIAVVGLSKAVHLAAGQGATCVVQWDGKVVCVGLGSELSGGLDEPRVARTVPGITDAREVALFDGHACVLRAEGKVSCWGQNSHGQLGMSAGGDIQRSPVEVTNLGAAAKVVTVGNGFSCALLVNGTVKCWGNNAVGQLGTALGGQATGLVTGVTTATAISAGQTAACAALHGGYVQCWGQGVGWGNGTCGALGGTYPEHPASWGPIADIAMCRPPGSFAPLSVTGLGAASDAGQVLNWAEKTMPGTFPAQAGSDPGSTQFYMRQYPGGHTLGINVHGTPHLLYVGPFGNGGLLDLGPLDRWLSEAREEEGAKSGLQVQADPYLNLMPVVISTNWIPGPCNDFLVPFAIRGGPNGLPKGLVATSVRVQNSSGTTMEFPVRGLGQYLSERLTTDTDWLSLRFPQPGQSVPAGMKLETVLTDVGEGCPEGVRPGDDVGVTVLYSLGGRKGQVHTRAKVSAAY